MLTVPPIPHQTVLQFDLFSEWTDFPQDLHNYLLTDIRHHVQFFRNRARWLGAACGYQWLSFAERPLRPGERLSLPCVIAGNYLPRPFERDPHETLVEQIRLLLWITANRFQRS